MRKPDPGEADVVPVQSRLIRATDDQIELMARALDSYGGFAGDDMALKMSKLLRSVISS
jgi:hypothetical protein